MKSLISLSISMFLAGFVFGQSENIVLPDRCTGDSWYIFKGPDGTGTCACNWKEVRELVNGDINCYEQVEVTIWDDRQGTMRPMPRKVRKYRVNATCVQTYNKVSGDYINGGYPITIEQSTAIRPQEDRTFYRDEYRERTSGGNHPIAPQYQKRSIARPSAQSQTPTQPKKDRPKPSELSEEEKYILELFKDEE